MRVLLINAPAQEEYKHGYLRHENALARVIKPRPQISRMPALSLLYLAPPLLQDGHQVQYLEGYFHDDDELLRRAEAARPDLVGLSAHTVNWERCRTLVARIKATPWGAQVWTVMGGVHVSLLREQALELCSRLDFVVYGEGEQTLRRLVAELAAGRHPDAVRGLIHRPTPGAPPRRTPPRPPAEDLDQLHPPARQLIDLPAYRPSPLFGRRLPHSAIIGARGCPFNCIFCHTDRRVRMRSPSNLVDELELLVRRYGVRDVTFWDDTFTLHKDRVHAICEEIQRRGLQVGWSANGRVDTVNLPMLRAMKQAGCYRVLWGLESGVQRHLDTLKKGTTPAQAREAVRMARTAKLQSLGMFLFGVPGETYADGLQTIDFACSLGLDLASFGFLTPYPGTELYDMIQGGDIGRIKTDAQNDIMNVSFIPHSINEQQLVQLGQLAFRRFYLRGGYVLRRALALRSPADLGTALRGLLNLVAVR